VPLKDIDVRTCPANPMPLRSIKTLERINHTTVVEFWKAYDAQQKDKK